MVDTENLKVNENMPLESYEFTYTEQEYKEARNAYFKGGIIRTVAFGLLCLGLGVWFCTSGTLDFIDGLFIGVWAMYLFVSVTSLIKVFTSWNNNLTKICSSVYNFRLTDEHLILDIKRDGERACYNRFELADLKQKVDVGKYYLVVFANQFFIVKKAELSENSIFHTLKPKDPEKPKKALKALSAVLMVLSIIAGVSGVICAMALHMSSGSQGFRWWYSYAFALIPVVSFFFGWYMRRKYNGGRGNTIAGLFAAVIIFAVFFSLGSPNTSDINKEQQIADIESYIGVDLPEPYAYDYFSDRVNGTYSQDTAMQFYGSDVGWLESAIKSSDYWLADFTDDTYELVKDVGTAEDWDYFIVYNITEGEYNKLPIESGVYNMAAIYYDMDFHGMYVIEYAYVQYEQ